MLLKDRQQRMYKVTALVPTVFQTLFVGLILLSGLGSRSMRPRLLLPLVVTDAVRIVSHSRDGRQKW
jgi:hypothetical protein